MEKRKDSHDLKYAERSIDGMSQKDWLLCIIGVNMKHLPQVTTSHLPAPSLIIGYLNLILRNEVN